MTGKAGCASHGALHLPLAYGSNTAMQNCILLTGAWLAALSPAIASATEPGDAPAAALQAAIVKSAAHARNLLDQADYKSLAQAAGSAKLLAELMQAKSDDATWQALTGKFVAAAGDVQGAARGEDATKCGAALDALDKLLAGVAMPSEPKGQPQSLPKPPAIRSLMATMDGIQADAKIAVLTGNIEAAKKQAFVLAELAKLVSNSKSGDKWSSLSAEFTKATLAAATTAETDPKAVRQLLRGVSQQCEACHDSSRTR